MTQQHMPSHEKWLELYDAVMVMIEPDLCSWNLDLLDTQYAGETKRQSAQRRERYALALQDFTEVLSGLTGSALRDFAAMKKQALAFAGEDDAAQTTALMGRIEDAITEA